MQMLLLAALGLGGLLVVGKALQAPQGGAAKEPDIQNNPAKTFQPPATAQTPQRRSIAFSGFGTTVNLNV